MIFQSNEELKFTIQKTGCYFLCLLSIVQIEVNRALTVKDINRLYNINLRAKNIDKNCRIIKPDQIINSTFDHFEIEKSIYQIGILKNGAPVYWEWVQDNQKDHSWIICEYKTTSEYGTHFVLMDKKNIEFYDPLNGKGYIASGINKLIYYRLF